MEYRLTRVQIVPTLNVSKSTPLEPIYFGRFRHKERSNAKHRSLTNILFLLILEHIQRFWWYNMLIELYYFI